MGIENLISRSKGETVDYENRDTSSDLRKSLEVLVEKDNPMADAAKRALERL